MISSQIASVTSLMIRAAVLICPFEYRRGTSVMTL